MTLNKREINVWKKKIEKQMATIAKERDAIDSLINDLISLNDSCERAYDALHEARDALSELV
jgi:hypothetical protein